MIVTAVIVLLVGAGWTIFWNIAANEAASSLDAWIAREKIFHRTWTCPDRQIGGYPVSIEIACSKPHFDGLIFRRHYVGSLAGFVATASLADPTAVTLNVESPFEAAPSEKGENISLAWNTMSVRLGGVPEDVVEVSVNGTGIALSGQTQETGALAMKATQAHATFTHDSGRQDRAIGFRIDLAGVSIPAVDVYLGGSAPADIAMRGYITQASFDPAQTLAKSLEQWSAAGGQIEIANFAANRAETKLEAHGALGLDPAHQIQGELDTKTTGFEKILLQLGVDPAIVTAGSLLATLLGGDKDSKGPQPLHLPVSFNNGRVSIGPVRTTIRVPPLY
jgi:hypothetical protein